MAIQYDSFGNPYDDTEYELDAYGNAVPIGDGVSASYPSGSTQPNDAVVYPYQGVGSSPASGASPDTAAAPAGATGVSVDGKSWIDAAGRIIAPIAVSALTPYLNNLQSGGLLSTGTDMLKNAGNALNGISAPDLTKLIPQLRLQVMQGQMTPAQAAAAIQEASGMQNVNTDAQSLQGQRDALAKLANIGDNNGMTEADRAALAATMNQTAAKTASDRAAQLQQMQMQGNAGTGAELAARLSGVQGGANANAMAGASTAQAAQLRALQAIQSGLQGNNALNTQQFDQAAKKAAAQDAVNSFNAQARQNTNLTNAGYQQQANATNFNTANDIAKTNVGIQNQQAMMPYNATQSNFENQLGLNKARSGVQIAAGTPLVKAATDQIARSSGAGAAQAANGGTGTAGTTGTGGSTVDPITGAITKGLTSAVASGAGDLISNGISKVAEWLGFADGGYVSPVSSSEMSDQDIDHMIAKMTDYKFRRKS
jgi:hypothetical protein